MDELTIGLPQFIYLLFNIISIIFLYDKKGREHKLTRTGTVLGWVFLTLPILWWGGFFS